MIKAVIFDMNGVLVNDEPVHEAAFKNVCENYGVELSHEEYQKMCLGRTDQEGFENLVKMHKINENIGNLIEQKTSKYFELIKGNLKAVPGSVELVKSVSSKFKLALVSSATRREVDMVLDSLKIGENFKVTVSADDILRGKPDPEPYLKASYMLRIPPQECVVIEDSTSGIKSVKSACMKCIAVTTSYPRKLLAQADKVVDNLSEITEDLLSTF